MDWKKEIGIAFLVRQRLAEVLPVWPLRHPRLAASAEEIAQAEREVRKLDEDYVGFLRAANGWEAFHQDIDLFGTADLLGSGRSLYSRELLSTLLPLEECSDVKGDEVIPVGVALSGIDLILLGPSREGAPAKVYWWAGQLIDQFVSFSEFFLAMVDLTRAEIARRTF
jgi:hypothetical protein